MEKQKKCHGRMSNLPTLEDKIFCVILYYRTYITHRFLGCLFNLHNANICRLLKKMEPLLAKKNQNHKGQNDDAGEDFEDFSRCEGAACAVAGFVA